MRPYIVRRYGHNPILTKAEIPYPVETRSLPRGLGTDPEQPREARLRPGYPGTRRRAAQGASGLLPRLPVGPRRRREEGSCRRGHPRRDEDEDRRSARAEVRERD